MKRSIPQGAMIYIQCVCPAWASLLYRRYGINLEGASPLWAGVTP
jgi:hypothetical protein